MIEIRKHNELNSKHKFIEFLEDEKIINEFFNNLGFVGVAFLFAFAGAIFWILFFFILKH